MIVPFIAGALISFILYNTFQDSGQFYVFLLFCGVSISITAFPVLARILSELDMLKTTVGFATITAASVDDVTAWVLLALVIALSGSASGLSALWILMIGVAYVLFVFFVIQRFYIKYLNREGFLNGRDPNPQVVFITFTMVFISAWFTDVLGIHAIFGAYIIGVIVPHNGGFAIKIAEKIEDLISIFFLPVYFALSGLNTNLGLLNSGKAWLLLILTVFASFFGKIAGCSLAARYGKFSWRESLTIGVLMSCKGLVELIVLNIGLQAKVINEKVFSILVLSALVTTFTTTPIVKYMYPRKHFKYVEDDKFDLHTNTDKISIFPDEKHSFVDGDFGALVVINRQKQLPAMITLVSLFSNPKNEKSFINSKLSTFANGFNNIQFYFLRLIEMTSRETSVMLHSESENFEFNDPVLATFRAFSQVSSISSTLQLSVSNKDNFAENILDYANNFKVDLTIIPALGKVETLGDSNYEPYSGILHDVNLSPYSKATQIDLINRLFKKSKSSVGIFINRGLISAGFCNETLNFTRKISALKKGSQESREHKNLDSLNLEGSKSQSQSLFTDDLDLNLPIIFIPFFGGPDDVCAVNTAINLCSKSKVNILIIYYSLSIEVTAENPSLSFEDFCESSPISVPRSVLRHDSPRANIRSRSVPNNGNNTQKGSAGTHPSKFNPNTGIDTPLKEMIQNTQSDFLFLGELFKVDIDQKLNSLTCNSNLFYGEISSNKNLLVDPYKISISPSTLNPSNGTTNMKASEQVENSLGSSLGSPKDIFGEHGNSFKKTGQSSSEKNDSNSVLGPLPKKNVQIYEELVSSPQFNDPEFKKNSDYIKDLFKSFKSPIHDNLHLRILKTSTPLLTSLSHTLILRSCDLVVCGRNVRDCSTNDKNSVDISEINSLKAQKFLNHLTELNGSGILNSFKVNDDDRDAIGVFGERVLCIKSRASNLIIQANQENIPELQDEISESV
ncbi:Cation/H(+) antiporter 19 [Smittium mucronatum]|uniref:Cation/H(+) antiporter 19 n=1 Tax=Smittium mucronatum TaxID=133383 RepID=A0A1R0GWR8_9FUNG|nr:Cation/H(+) antiporter 19 [Smittium mucronatum]